MTYLNNANALRTLENKALERAASEPDPNRSRECIHLATRYGQLATASQQVLTITEAEPHEKDEDCTVDPATDLCVTCGVLHGEPCAACGGKGFHKPHCPIFLDGYAIPVHNAEQTTMNMDSVLNPIVLAYMAVMLGLVGWAWHIFNAVKHVQ